MLRWVHIVLAFLFVGCVLSPQPSPPNLNHDAVVYAGNTMDIVDGVRAMGSAGAVDPPEGVVVGTNLDVDEPPVTEPVREDGSFDVVIPADTLANEFRLQARNGIARSEPFDFVLDSTTSRLVPPAHLSCLALDPAYEIDFGDLRVGQSADRTVSIRNDCDFEVAFAPSSFREAITPFSVIAEPTSIAAHGSATITVRATPTTAGSIEGTLFVTASAPSTDRRALSLFVRSAE